MSEKLIDTIEQSKAQLIDRHISVTANAGSGKTTILKKRFIKIALNLGNNYNPRRMVAITFTRKAASEIFLRIAEEIDNLINADIDANLKNKLAKIRAELKMANIATIHTFCLALLREFPIEADVSPNFTEITNADRYVLIKDAVFTAITEELNNNDKTLEALIRDYSRNCVEEAIQKILNKKEMFETIKNYLENNDNKTIYQNFTNEFLYYLTNKIINIYPHSIFDEILSNTPLDKKIHLEAFLNQINEINTLIISNDYTYISLLNLLKPLKQLFNNLQSNKIITSEGNLNKRTFKNYHNKNNNEISQIISQIKEILPMIDILISDYDLDIILGRTRCIFDVARKADEFIQEEKSNNNYLDFDDLIIKTRDILRDEDTAKKIRAKFDFVMIDEFQDTNYLQYDIVKALIPELNNINLNSNINLFIVGDPKQSIYGFRNADVRVFKQATQDIKNTNSYKHLDNIIIDSDKEIVLTNNEKLGEMALSVSFRHYPVISLFVNTVCSNLMSEINTDYDVDYNDLICSQQVKKFDDSNENEFVDLGYEYGSVHFFITDMRKNNKNNDNQSEFEKMAIFIKKIIDEQYFNKEYKYSDIAILFRKSNKIPEMINALQKYEIPYEATGSKGFFYTPEIIDLISVLRFLNNRYDNHAFLATLRSMFFTEFPYEEFLELGSQHGYYWDYFKKNASQNEKLYTTLKILETLLELSSKLSIPHLILKIIELTHIESLLNRYIAREQITANIKKFINISRDFEKKGFKNLHDFIKYVDYIINYEIEEEEEILISENDSVKILTIHKAKGLEFKIVILMDSLSSSGGKNDYFVFDEKLGIIFKENNYDENYEIEIKDNILTYMLNNKIKFKGYAEDKRLIYVALTRAKEHLIISGTYMKSEQNLYMNEILKAFNTNAKELLDHSQKEILCCGNLKFFNDQKLFSKYIGFKINVLFEDLQLNNKNIETKQIKIEEQKSVTDKLILLNKIQSSYNNEFISATKLLKYNEGIQNYLKKYLLEFDENDDYEGIPRDADDDIISKDYGSFIHLTFEKIDNWINEQSEIQIESLTNVLINSAAQIGILMNQDLLSRSLKTIKTVMSTKLLKNNKQNIKNSLKEYEVYLPFRDDFIIAKIDFLLIENQKILEIWDWKTSNIEHIDEMEEIANKYEIQMKLYAYTLKNLFDHHEKIKARLLFTNLAKEDCIDADWTYLFEWTKKDLDAFESILTEYIENIKVIV